MKKYFPGLRLGDGSIIERVYRAERKWAFVYADDDPEGRGKPTRTLLLRIRMDIGNPDGTMKPDRWFVIRNPIGCEWFTGHWDGRTIVEWDDANRKIEPSPCADCGATTRRWDHISREPVCWDCGDKSNRKKRNLRAYARPPAEGD